MFRLHEVELELDECFLEHIHALRIVYRPAAGQLPSVS